jgi:hypothetical protein
MVVSDIIIKRINTLEQFARNKAKLLTKKRVDIDITIGLKNHTGTGNAMAQIRVAGNIDTKKYHYQILINDVAFERLPIDKLKGIILHELSHISDYENVIHGRTKKECAPHGSEFKKACKTLQVPKEFARAQADIAKPKRRIVKLK